MHSVVDKMKLSEWIKKLPDKDMSKKPFLAMSEEEVKKLDERFINREDMLVMLEDKRCNLNEILDDLKKEVREKK